MAEYQLLIDLYKRTYRQGPGGDAASEKALSLTRTDRTAPVTIADIGCGTGASTLFLARVLNARITAVDFLHNFLEVLEARAENMGLSEKITTLCCSMDNLPFEEAAYDILWSEGAIYTIGFERGVQDWRRFLKVGGFLVVSELTWITASRPSALQQYWEGEYPEIDVASSKIGILEKHGYAPVGYFVLPEQCWLENFYRPLQKNFSDFLSRNNHSEAAQALVEAENQEIELYETYKAHYSYGFYVARKEE
mgnify:CR=1 FL=1